MGFCGLLELKCYQLHSNLCMWLVRKVNVANHRLDLEKGQHAILSSVEVGNAMGIPHRG